MIFWILMLIFLLFGGYGWFRAETRPAWSPGGFLLWLILVVVGIRIFGWPIQGG